VFDHLERQIVFLLIGGADSSSVMATCRLSLCGGDLSIEIVTGVAAHDSTLDERSRPADLFVLVRSRTLRGRLPSGT